LPGGAVARLGTVRLRHGGIVSGVAWAPDGKLVAAGGHEPFIHLWDPASGKEIARLPALTRYVYCLAFSPDGKWLATAGDNPAINLWDAQLFGKQAQPRQLPGHQRTVSGLAFAPDNATLYSAGGDGLIRAWDIATGKELRSFGPGKRRVNKIALDRSGKMLVSLHTDGEFGNKQVAAASLWNPTTGEQIRSLGKPEPALYDIAFAPDGLTVIAGGDQGAKIWEVASGAEVGKVRGEANYTPGVAFAPDGASAWVGGSGFFRQLAVPSGRQLRSLDVDRSYVYRIQFSPDGKTIATGNTRMVAFWDAATGKPKHQFTGHQADVSSILFTAGGKELLTAGYGRPIYRWDLQGRLLGEWAGPDHWNSNCVLSPDGKTLAIQGRNLAIWLLDPVTGKERLRFTNHLPPRSSAHTQMEFVFTADSRRVVSAAHGIDNYIRTWDADTGKELGKIQIGKPFAREVRGLALSPDGQTIYVASQEGMVKVLDAANGELKRTIGKMDGGIGHLRLSRDGRWLAAVTSAAVVVWDAATGSELRRLPRLGGYAPRLAFSPDGRMLANYSDEEPLRLWELLSGKLRVEVTAHAGRVVSLAFSGDGRLMATASADTTALLWDLWALPLVGELAKKPDLETLWSDLASPDAKAAYRAIARWQQMGARAAVALATRLKPANMPPVQKLLADLGDDKFRVRERATVELAALAPGIQDDLAKALATTDSPEVRRRLQRILDTLRTDDPTRGNVRLRSLRVLEVLEGIATPEARQALEALARGTPGTEVTIEALAALKRMGPGGR